MIGKLQYMFLFLILSACASGVELSKTDVLNEKIPSGESQIIVYRPSIFGAAIQPKVYVDNVETGQCQPQGVFIVKSGKGTHNISATTEVTKQLTIDVKPEETAYVRCSIGFGLMTGRPELTRVSNSVGEAEASNLKFTGVHCLPSSNC